MPRYEGEINIGDVLVTREGPWYVSLAIRFGAFLRGKPAKCNHVIVVHHQDSDGIWWGIEATPHKVSYRELTGPASWAMTNANTAQLKTDSQRLLIAVAMEEMLGVAYDWAAIVTDAQQAAHWFWQQAKEWTDDETPGSVVCSALADWAYEKVGLVNPGGNKVTRMTTPGDWDEFIMKKGWTSTTTFRDV